MKDFVKHVKVQLTKRFGETSLSDESRERNKEERVAIDVDLLSLESYLILK